MTTIKQLLQDALTTEGQSYAELGARIGMKLSQSHLNKCLRQLEAAGLAVRYPTPRAKFAGCKPVDRQRRPKVLWRRA
jgi:DNA-binding HxlR family transcriptional regulator